MNVDNNLKHIYCCINSIVNNLGKYFGIKTLVIDISLSFLPLVVTAVLSGTFFPVFTLLAILSGMIYIHSFYIKKDVICKDSGNLFNS